jgi:hypothetical protein
MTDQDLERITKIAAGGLADSREDEDAPADLRLDTFVIVAEFIWTDEDGEEREGAAVWGESRHHYVKEGLLRHGLDTIRDAFD